MSHLQNQSQAPLPDLKVVACLLSAGERGRTRFSYSKKDISQEQIMERNNTPKKLPDTISYA